MNYPSPRHWLLLDAICRCHSLSLAADQLALSQPAASQALKELEQRLGIPVIFTTKPAVSADPTHAGFITQAAAIAGFTTSTGATLARSRSTTTGGQ